MPRFAASPGAAARPRIFRSSTESTMPRSRMVAFTATIPARSIGMVVAVLSLMAIVRERKIAVG